MCSNERGDSRTVLRVGVSDQLSRQSDPNTATPPPLQYAELLALRTFEYFRDDVELQSIDRSAKEYESVRHVQSVPGFCDPHGEIRERRHRGMGNWMGRCFVCRGRGAVVLMMGNEGRWFG
jgi:hypothetical protein